MARRRRRNDTARTLAWHAECLESNRTYVEELRAHAVRAQAAFEHASVALARYAVACASQETEFAFDE